MASISGAVIVIAICTFISVCIILVLRFLFHRFSISSTAAAASTIVTPASFVASSRRLISSELNSRRLVSLGDQLLLGNISSMPIFNYSAATAAIINRDCDNCVVCLEKFEDKEELAYLPVCMHFFHKLCLAKWFRSLEDADEHCPICRQLVFLYENQILAINDEDINLFQLGSVEASAEASRRSSSVSTIYHSIGGSFRRDDHVSAQEEEEEDGDDDDDIEALLQQPSLSANFDLEANLDNREQFTESFIGWLISA